MISSSISASKRIHCTRCFRPETTCICHWIQVVESPIEVLILQHPLEVSQAKGSVRLLHLCLPNSQIWVGERFDENRLETLDQQRVNVLLYPSETQPSETLPSQTSFQDLPTVHNESIRLIVIDGTWRKSRKILHLNQQLQNLPRLSLTNMPDSHYRIRKAHKIDQLSSLEATCYALMQLDPVVDKYKPLLSAFDGFIEQQMSWIPPK